MMLARHIRMLQSHMLLESIKVMFIKSLNPNLKIIMKIVLLLPLKSHFFMVYLSFQHMGNMAIIIVDSTYSKHGWIFHSYVNYGTRWVYTLLMEE